MDEDKKSDVNLDKKTEGKMTVGGVITLLVILAFVVGLIFLIVKVFGFLWSEITSDTGSTQNKIAVEQVQKKEYTDIEAYVNAQVILEKFLQSPSTAEYPLISEAMIKRYDDNSFQVSAYVDSQNGFGAMIRSEWTVFLKFEGDSVKTRGVIFDGEVLYKEESTEQP